MLELKQLLNNFDEVKKQMGKRKFDLTKLDEIKGIAVKRSEVMTKLQNLEAEKNSLSKKIGELKAKKENADDLMNQVANVKTQIEAIKNDEAKINEDLKEKMLYIPNIPSANVPEGKDDSENVVIASHDNLGRGLITNVKPHYDAAINLGIVDFERAVKMSGTRFWAYIGQGSRLVRALENFMLDTHTSKGYTEMRPPVIVNSKTMQGTGQLPKFKEDLFKLEGLDAYLIPTAEVPVTNFYQDEIIDVTSPIKFTAFTPCFRAEAGSGGRDMRGLIRAHQFNKVELVKLVSHKDLKTEFEKTVADAKAILEMLELPFRELQLCSGDLGFSSEETIDLEVWIPSEGKFREISSVSRFGDFQGRRASIRYKAENANQPVCTINGSGLAIDRTIAAILENYQNEDGTITIPKVLVKYMGGETLIKKETK